MTARRRSCTSAFLAALILVGPARAQPGPAVPPPLQAITFDKIFSFDRALGDRTKLRVLLVYNHDPEAGGKEAALALQKAFAAATIAAEPVLLSAAADKLQPGTVLYFLAGTATPDLLKAAAAAKVLTIAGESALAEQGKVSVGLALRGDKAEIVVNLDRVAQEGHDFSAQLLKFARVVRGGAVVSAGSASPAGQGAETPAPVLVGFTKPEYPALARRFGVQGDVVLRLAVDVSGKVTGVELMKGLGRGGLDEAAMSAARSARFRPASRNGQAVPSSYVLIVPFRL